MKTGQVVNAVDCPIALPIQSYTIELMPFVTSPLPCTVVENW